MMHGRDTNYPSIEPSARAYLNYWQSDTALLDLFDESDMSSTSRIEALVADITVRLRQDPCSKFVIFSQYGETLELLNKVLPKKKIPVGGSFINLKSVSLDTKGKKDIKTENLRKFCEEPEYNICLLLMGTSAAGLNLTVANVCYFLEPTHNAADEAQAMGRVHRIGQEKEVQCVIFYTKNTFEERLLALRYKDGTLTSWLKADTHDDEDGNTTNDRMQGKSAFFNQTNISVLFGLT
jgi:SNF2 family DNA or RNA helicase